MAANSIVNSQPPVYVGFWARVWASIIDSVLLVLLMIPASLIIFGSSEPDALDSDTPAHFVFSALIPAMIVVLFWIRRQATPGKVVIHARIVDAVTGADPRPGQLVLRYVGYYVSLLILGLGFVWIAFDRRKQGLHDKIATTVVVRDDGWAEVGGAGQSVR